MQENDKGTDNQLVGRCPVCSPPESNTEANDAYSASTINDSDKDVYLEWSNYYQIYVCRLCRIHGEDRTVDDVRNDEDREREKRRMKMGFKKTYVTNSIS